MIPTIQILVLLLVVVAAVAVVAARLEIPPAILLVLTGVALALIPGLPTVELAPELVLLLGAAAGHLLVGGGDELARVPLQSAADLAAGGRLRRVHDRRGRRGGALAAGPAWPVGFVLGAIVSPPDAVAPLSIARRMQLPRRILVVLEGEGLANDATALILYRFAVAAVSAGVFSLGQAAGTFVAIVVGEILWGIGVGWLMLRLRRWVHDPRSRDHALGADAVSRLLAAGASRRLRRARHRHRRALHQLERPSPDQRRDAAARHLLLGFLHLPDRGPGVPDHRPAGAHADRPHRRTIRCPSSPSPPPWSAPS